MQGTWVAMVVLIVVSGSMGLLIPLSHLGTPSGALAKPSHAAPDQLPATHSDLVVGPGQLFVIQPTLSGPTYYQGGNITVEAGGTLIVRNVTLSFVQFVSNSGTAEQRLSHIYHFLDSGTVDFYNANLTTDALVINAYAKLNLTVTGTLGAWNSTFAFPGWINVMGSQAVMTLNGSKVIANPEVAGLNEPPAIYGDTLYAATVNVSGGATMNLFASQLTGTYADNQILNGIPRPLPLTNLSASKLTGAGVDYTAFQTPTDSANLTLDWSYPGAGARSGFITVYYDDTNGPGTAVQSNNTVAPVSVGYGGTAFPLGSLTFLNSSFGTQSLSFTPGLLAAISQAGMLNYLNYTGDFGVGPSKIAVDFGTVTGPSVSLSGVQFQMNTTGLSYDITVTGAGSTLSAADSSLGLTWNLPPANNNPYSLSAPYPWSSNKLLLEDGANAYLANLTVPSSIPGVFSSSAVLPDAQSFAYFYRWAQFNLTGAGGLALAGAHVAAYYAYNTDQLSNATANALNTLSTADPSIWGYVQYWDSLHGIPAYATSDLAGRASLLLASSDISGPTLPDGSFLGGYHIGITVPAASIKSHWFNWSVSPYPEGVAMNTPGYDRADFGPAQSFPQFTLSVRFAFFNATVPATTTINLGQQYISTGNVVYNGSQAATVTLTATPAGGVTSILIASTPTLSGHPFTMFWGSLQGVLSPGTSYTLTATATYDGSRGVYNVPGTFSVPSSTPSSPTSFFNQKFLGLPLWVWLAIAGAVVAGLVAFLLVARRQAAGKLVECGECGNLIPEEATVCPKCGAEFEADLIRCSRCASTIPADSKECPECAAQLLGKPGEGEADPERQGYADFTEKYRAEAKREFGENYSEGAFWDWWKRQPSYTSFNQWKLQQGSGTPRAGMTAPPVGRQTAYVAAPVPRQPPRGGGGAAAAARMPVSPPVSSPPASTPQAPTGEGPMAAGGALTACPNCGKEIPPEYLVCPFCGAVTQ
jgi:RNA polymerase subunit RPABC4/transcription elongation factor Spt4